MIRGVIHNTLGEVLGKHAAEIGDRVFLTFRGKAYTYQEVDKLTNCVAHGLAALGISKGDHVGLLLGNCTEFVWSMFGLAKIGAVAVPFNTAAKGELLGYFLNHSKVTVLIAEENLITRCENFVSKSTQLKTVVSVPDPTGAPPDTIPSITTIPFKTLFTDNNTVPTVDLRYSDPMFLMYTSGTTGPSKGVVAPHSQALSIGDQLVSVYGYTDEDVLYTCLPLFHGNAIWYSLMPALICGATLALARRFSASRFWQQVIDAGATQANALGAMVNIIIKELDQIDTSKLKLRQCMVVPALNEGAGKPLRDLGIKLTSLFAQTETFAVTLYGPDAPPGNAWIGGSRLSLYGDNNS
jgi:crotonobetaine/carnitine-CoA ligase